MRFTRFPVSMTVCLVSFTLAGVANELHGFEVLGTGTENLFANLQTEKLDLTDPENDGDPEDDFGYNAIFRANNEEGFGGGEFAFNVFDNVLGPGNDKWCCGPGGGIPEDGLWVEAQLIGPPALLTDFTVSSANDVPARDPNHWAIQGSNDGENYDTIFEQDEDEPLWDARLQVIKFTAGEDFPVQDTAYQIFRHVTFNTPSNPDGAFFQIGEIELFGLPDAGDFAPGDFNEDGSVNFADFTILATNFNQSFGFDVSYARGDFTRNGTVDLIDFLEFRDAFAASNGGAAAVPEPGTFGGLAVFMTLCLGARQRRRS